MSELTPIQQAAMRANDTARSRAAYRAVMTVRVPGRFVLHHERGGWWVYHEKNGTCIRRGDPYCSGITGGTSSSGIANGRFTERFVAADAEARKRFGSFAREMQARGRYS